MNEDLQQHLMEFVYGLLDEAEASALCDRITSDPQVARAYATVKLQCDLVARAARCEIPAVAWIRPEEAISTDTDVQASSQTWSAGAYRRLANWCVGVAAVGLMCLVGSTFWMSSHAGRSESTPHAVATATPVRVVLTGPSKLHSETSNPFTIHVEDKAGTPVSTTLNCRVYNTSGAVSWQDSTSTDESGVARFDVEADFARDASRLEVTTTDDSPAPILRELEAAPERFATYLRLDRPLYQPGEPVHYRSVTLSRFGLRAEREALISYEIVDSNDAQLAGSIHDVATEQGVGSGTFRLPSDLPDGTYTLFARSPDAQFREEWRDFHVRRHEAPRLLKKLELAKDSYTAGDEVELDYSARRVAGEPLAELQLRIQATLDGFPLATPPATTDAEGHSRFSLRLPESIERGAASVSVTVQEGDDSAETITKEIPINLGKVNVDFYPEGGDLAADLPSRVYFYGRDPLGKPTHIEGRVVDSIGNDVTKVVTSHEGRGVFSFTPLATERYRLMIDKPVGFTKELSLPATSPVRSVAIDTGEGVFDANAPIAFTLHQRTPARPMIIAAYCRGAMVGQQTIDPDTYTADNAAFATFRAEISLPEAAQGVVRLTVFDASRTPPESIAERLVYRRVSHELDVRIEPNAQTFAPGQSVELTLEMRDENEIRVPAALGISVVDDAILNLAEDKSVRMPTYFHLLTEMDSPEQLEDANFYLSENLESAAALDSLLGTQGWRRFREVPGTQLAQAGAAGFGGGALGLSIQERNTSWSHRSLAWFEDTAVPISTATTVEVLSRSAARSIPSARDSFSGRKRFASPLVIASIILLVLVGVASLRWARSNRSLRVIAGVVAVVSLLVGLLSLPMPPSRVGQTTNDAASTAAVAMISDERDTEMAAKDGVTSSEALGSERGEGFLFEADDAVTYADDVPQDSPELESGQARQLPQPADGAARFAAPRNPASSQASGTGTELLRNKEKKAEIPLPAARSLSASGALPASGAVSEPAASETAPSQETARPSVNAPVGRTMIRAEKSDSSADESNRRLVTREYAQLFFDPESSAPQTGESSSTIVWIPLHFADDSGRASVFFNLPSRPSSLRAIVEAHGAGRLGAGELLIDSR